MLCFALLIILRASSQPHPLPEYQRARFLVTTLNSENNTARVGRGIDLGPESDWTCLVLDLSAQLHSHSHLPVPTRLSHTHKHNSLGLDLVLNPIVRPCPPFLPATKNFGNVDNFFPNLTILCFSLLYTPSSLNTIIPVVPLPPCFSSTRGQHFSSQPHPCSPNPPSDHGSRFQQLLKLRDLLTWMSWT